MVHRYLHKFPRDRWSLKALVLTVLMIDIASSVGNYAYVYLVGGSLEHQHRKPDVILVYHHELG
jgi:hypothetical protein